MGFAFVEPVVIQDVFVSGVMPEDLNDGTMRFTGFVPQKSIGFEGVEYVIVNRVIMPKQSIMESIKATMTLLGIACDGERLRRLDH
jgi:hypothetical protein